MAEKITRLKAFVSGPADVEDYREAAKKIADQVNNELRLKNVSLNIIDMKDLRPGVSKTAQGEVNIQINDADVYIGILRSRFGTPTDRAGSGTEEEFNDAVSRYRRASTTTRVLIYFVTQIENLHALDLDQFSKLKEFRKRIGNDGVFFVEIKSVKEFAGKIKMDLIDLINKEWDSSESKWESRGDFVPVADGKMEQLDEGEEGLEDPLGYLDIAGLINEQTERFGVAAEQLTEQALRLQSIFETYVNRIKVTSKNVAEAKRIVDLMTKELEDVQSAMHPQVLLLQGSQQEIFDTMDSLLPMLKDPTAHNLSVKVEELEQLRDVLASMGAQFTIASQPMNVTAEMLRNFPPATKALKKATRTIAEDVSLASAALGIMASRADYVVEKLNEFLSQRYLP